MGRWSCFAIGSVLLVALANVAPAAAGGFTPKTLQNLFHRFLPRPNFEGVDQCGQVLEPDTKYRLTANLSCPDATVLEIPDGASLDLHGHTIECTSGGQTAIDVTGPDADVINGSIKNCVHGIHISPDGEGAGIKDLDISNAATGIWIQSEYAEVFHVTVSVASGAGHFGMLVEEGRNYLHDVTVKDAFIGILVQSGALADNNTVSHSAVYDCTNVGISVNGKNHVILDNKVNNC